MGESNSIFNHASKGSKKIEPKLQREKKEPPSKTLSDEEIRELFQAVYKLNDTVAKKLDQVYNYLGTSPNDIKNFLENPNNFPSNLQWTKVQESRSNMLNRLEKNILYQGKMGKEGGGKKEKKKKEEAADKKRKGKTLGPRKGWISM